MNLKQTERARIQGNAEGEIYFPLPGEKALGNNENIADLMFNAMEN